MAVNRVGFFFLLGILGLTALVAPGARAQEPASEIFEDDFEIGDTSGWSLTGPRIFEDDFELGDASLWSEIVPPIFLRIESPAEGSFIGDDQPGLELIYGTPSGLGIDPASLVLTVEGRPLEVGCMTESLSPSVLRSICSPTEALSDGVIEVEASVADVLGQTAAPASIRFTIDTQAPEGLELPLLVLAQDMESIIITGHAGAAEPHARVRIMNGRTGQVVEVPVASDGSFSTSIIGLEGDRLHFAVLDAADNASPEIILPTPFDIPPDPATRAPPRDRTVATRLGDALEFLWTGPDPIQVGVAEGAIDERRIGWTRGRVLDRAGLPVPGVRVRVLDRDELGRTHTRADGVYDLVINGGGPVVLDFERSDYLPVQREAHLAWRESAWLEDVALTALDPAVTNITSGASNVQVARGTPQTDLAGTRTATLMFPAGVNAEKVMADGSRTPLPSLAVRATEYTVGPEGPKAMPAALPDNVGYTYAVELSADEALAAGAVRVDFDRPVSVYVENYLGFPVGDVLPVGHYDRQRGQWIGFPDGRVIRVLGVGLEGEAELDIDGTGSAASASVLEALGLSLDERVELAKLYEPGTELWWVRVPHFSPWDFNKPWIPPEDAVPPPDLVDPPLLTGGTGGGGSGGGGGDGGGDPDAHDPDEASESDPCASTAAGSIIQCENQTLQQAIPIVGAPVDLWYSSDRVEGRSAELSLRIPITGESVPASVISIEAEVVSGGVRYVESFPAEPNLVWDLELSGEDAFGQPLIGAQPVKIRRGYTYPIVYAPSREGFEQSWSRYPEGSYSVPIPGPYGRVTLWSDNAESYDQVLKWTAGKWDSRGQKLGGFALDLHHAYDPNSRTVYRGDGDQQSARLIGPVIHKKADAFLHPTDVVMTRNGTLYVADPWSRRVWQVDRFGQVEPYAGDGSVCLTFGGGGGGGDGGVRSDGAFFVATPDGVQFIPLDGIISTVVENFQPGGLTIEPASTKSGTAKEGGLPLVGPLPVEPASLALGPGGVLYITDRAGHQIFALSPSGKVEVVAGNGLQAISPDGSVATEAGLDTPEWITATRDGRLYFAEAGSKTIRRLDTDGRLYTSAGDGDSGPVREGEAALQASFERPAGLVMSPDGELTVVDNGADTVYVVAPPLDGYPEGTVLVPSGGEVYAFDAEGRHLETRHALTGAVLYTFGYEAEGLLVTLTDADSLVTTIERDPATGDATAIVGPFGQRTTLAMDANGYLESVTNPADESFRFEYVAGLMTRLEEPRYEAESYPEEAAKTYAHDGKGRLLEANDAEEGSTSLRRRNLEGQTDFGVSHRTAEGVVTDYRHQRRRTGEVIRQRTFSDGTTATSTRASGGSTTTELPDGSTFTAESSPDPRFGLLSSFTGSASFARPGGQTGGMQATRSVVLSDPSDPWSLETLSATSTVDGRTTSMNYKSADRQFTHTSPALRTSTMEIDPEGRLLTATAAGVEPLAIDYLDSGLVDRLRIGTGEAARELNLDYDPLGRLVTVTDPEGEIVGYGHDAANRVTSVTLPDLETVGLGYDANGNVTSITPPGRPAHGFTYTRRNQLATRTLPDVGSGVDVESYVYDADGRPVRIEEPDGTVIELAWEPEIGRLDTITTPEGVLDLTYFEDSGQLESLTTADAEVLTFAYNGPLVTSVTASGTVEGSVEFTHDPNFRLDAIRVNGADPIIHSFDADSLLTSVGALAIGREAETGRISTTALGLVESEQTYNRFGELESITWTWDGDLLYSESYAYDKRGWVVGRVRTTSGVTETLDYQYDARGRLREVKLDGEAQSSYAYDANSNRTSYDGPFGTVTETEYDARDRLESYGDLSFEHNAAGDLIGKSRDEQTVRYTHDAYGSLRRVELPAGTVIDYVTDGLGRRIGKKVDGELTRAWLYQDRLRPLAELDGDGNVVSRFVYGTRTNVPDYLVKDGTTYRIVPDHLGSPRLIIDVATGIVVHELRYDEFGRITLDTNPGFQPFGFAGGLYDHQTGLVRYGARDYDPELGRWTTPDPAGFAGQSWNLYAYVDNNPVIFIDSKGTNRGHLPGTNIPYRMDMHESPEPDMHIYWNDGTETNVTSRGGWKRGRHRNRDLVPIPRRYRKAARQVISEFLQKVGAKAIPIVGALSWLATADEVYGIYRDPCSEIGDYVNVAIPYKDFNEILEEEGP